MECSRLNLFFAPLGWRQSPYQWVEMSPAVSGIGLPLFPCLLIGNIKGNCPIMVELCYQIWPPGVWLLYPESCEIQNLTENALQQLWYFASEWCRIITGSSRDILPPFSRYTGVCDNYNFAPISDLRRLKCLLKWRDLMNTNPIKPLADKN